MPFNTVKIEEYFGFFNQILFSIQEIVFLKLK